MLKKFEKKVQQKSGSEFLEEPLKNLVGKSQKFLKDKIKKALKTTRITEESSERISDKNLETFRKEPQKKNQKVATGGIAEESLWKIQDQRELARKEKYP